MGLWILLSLILFGTVSVYTSGKSPPDNDVIASRTVTANPAMLQAILVKKSLFVDIRNRGPVYCAADGPLLVIAEINGQFVALNGTAQSFAEKQSFSIYRNEKWIRVIDRGPMPFGLDPETVQELIDVGANLCPSSAGEFLAQSISRIRDGEERYVRIGADYGLR